MYERHKYKEGMGFEDFDEPVGTIKYDGAHFFLRINKDGSPSYISRRQSVKGHYPDRTAQLPHLSDFSLPKRAGNVYSVELIHTGHDRDAKESHNIVSGILNSLPPRAISSQMVNGPVRAVLLDVIHPKITTYRDKMDHLQKLQQDIKKPDLIFTPELKIGKAEILKLIKETKKKNQEGVIVTSLTAEDAKNPRWKIKHFRTYNLRVVGTEEEVDKNGKPKGTMGSLVLQDSTGRMVGKVGTGFSREDRRAKWVGRLIQVKAMDPLAGQLRQAVYNGEADGDIDRV